MTRGGSFSIKLTHSLHCPEDYPKRPKEGLIGGGMFPVERFNFNASPRRSSITHQTPARASEYPRRTRQK